jgi:hypothetical protein
MRFKAILFPLVVLLHVPHIQRVRGRVIDDVAAPIENALVELTVPATGERLSTRTNATGAYEFRDVDIVATAEVLVRRIGFKPAHFVLTGSACSTTATGNVQMLPVARVAV